MTAIPPHPSRPPGEWTAEALAAELLWQDNADQPWQIIMEIRLLAIEEALCSRRSRRRLRREILATVRQFRWAGGFTAARMEAVGNQALTYYDNDGGCGVSGPAGLVLLVEQPERPAPETKGAGRSLSPSRGTQVRAGAAQGVRSRP
jgi:hypothetical protein